jgi:gliding motility-associated-like protein
MTTVNLNGCNDIFGCHFWSMDIGDTNTINSWWYVASSTIPAVRFKVKRSPGSPGVISGNSSFCYGGITDIYSVNLEQNSTIYNWSYSGAGAAVSGNGASATVAFSVDASSGVLSVTGNNPDCGDGPASILPITFNPPPQVTQAGFDSICYNEPAFPLTGGSPPGGEYSISGAPILDFDPAAQGNGSHQIVYLYTDDHGCKNSDTATLFVKNGRECEIVIWVPNAFSPDGDGLNDMFRPVSNNIRQYSLNIYSRYGELVFTSAQPDNGWDGTFQGESCPEGNYIYVIVYQSSFTPPENTTLTGNIVLVR